MVKNVKSGGVLLNVIGLKSFYLSLHKTNNFIYISNEEYLPVINKMQNVSFSVNAELIQYIFKNISSLIQEDIIPNFVFINLTAQELYSIYLSSTPRAMALSFNLYKIKIYYKKFSKAHKFYSNLLVAIMFCDFPNLYYPINIDFRGRMYSQSDYLNPQGSDFEKSLLEFTQESTLDTLNTINNWKYAGMSLFKTFKTFTGSIEGFNSQFFQNLSLVSGNLSVLSLAKEPFQFLAFCCEIRKNSFQKAGEAIPKRLNSQIQTAIILSLDSSQSSNQISSALVLNKEVLQKTNILNKFMEKQDLYQFVSDIIIQKLDVNISVSQNMSLLNNFELNYSSINSRSFFKKVVMAAVNYGLTPYTFRKEININYPLLHKDLINIIVKETYSYLYDKNGIFFRQYSFFKFFRKVMIRRNCNVDINLFKKESLVNFCLIKEKKYNPIRINLFNNLCLDIFYMKGKSIIFRPYILGKQYYFTIRHHVNEDLTLIKSTEMDKRKIEQGFLANFIHSLDAEICYRVLKHFLDRNISIRSNHDCFYLSPKYHDELRNVFRDVFYKIFKNPKELFLKMLQDNNIDLTDKECKYFDDFFDRDDFNLASIYDAYWFLS